MFLFDADCRARARRADFLSFNVLDKTVRYVNFNMSCRARTNAVRTDRTDDVGTIIIIGRRNTTTGSTATTTTHRLMRRAAAVGRRVGGGARCVCCVGSGGRVERARAGGTRARVPTKHAKSLFRAVLLSRFHSVFPMQCCIHFFAVRLFFP